MTATGPHWAPRPPPGSTERERPPPKTPSTPLLNHRSATAPTGLYCLLHLCVTRPVLILWTLLSVLSNCQCAIYFLKFNIQEGLLPPVILFVTLLCPKQLSKGLGFLCQSLTFSPCFVRDTVRPTTVAVGSYSTPFVQMSFVLKTMSHRGLTN